MLRLLPMLLILALALFAVIDCLSRDDDEVRGLPKVLWLQDPSTAMPALILMSLWGIGGTMVIYLAGLQGIPQHLYEAAEIDGANYWNRFRHVTIPMMSPVIFFTAAWAAATQTGDSPVV